MLTWILSNKRVLRAAYAHFWLRLQLHTYPYNPYNQNAHFAHGTVLSLCCEFEVDRIPDIIHCASAHTNQPRTQESVVEACLKAFPPHGRGRSEEVTSRE